MTGFISVLDQPKSKEEREYETWTKLFTANPFGGDLANIDGEPTV
jgi:hypothetical protein